LIDRKADSLSASVDHAQTFASVADIAVSTLADACFIDVLGDGGKIRRTAAAYSEGSRPLPGDPGTTGSAWAIRTGRSLVYPAAFKGTSRADDPPHIRPIRKLFKSAMVVPMQARGKMLGAITFAREERGRPYTSADLVSAEDLAHRAALAIDNANLFQQAQKELEERRRAEARLSFLAEASRRLDEALDYPAALECAAKLATSNLADWCLIDLIDDEGILRRQFTATADPAKASWVQDCERRFPPRPDLNDELKNAVVTGDSSLYAEVPRAFLQEHARGAEHLRMIESLGLKSLMIVPMRARSRILGVISLLSAESCRRYGPEDLAMAEDLAHRAALAIESALLLRGSEEAVQARDEFISVASHEQIGRASCRERVS
jgi:GAF domain-containing protein